MQLSGVDCKRSPDAERAIAEYDHGNYEVALNCFQKLAKGGDTEAYYYLGMMYKHGQGVIANSLESRRCFKRFVEQILAAAKSGDASAQFRVGKMYQYGDVVDKDEEQAVSWYTISAENGYADAQFHLSRLYLYGWCGLAKNYDLEAHWLDKAVTQEHPEALYALAVEYLGIYDENGDEDARQSAIRLLRSSAEAGFTPAQEALSTLR